MSIKPFVPYRPMAGLRASVPPPAAPPAGRFHFFWGGPFSNWYLRDFEVDGLVYNCNEQFMMAEKARLFGDAASAARVMEARTPKEQKAIGRDVAPFDEAVWIENRVDIVAEGATAKFSQHDDLAAILLATDGARLVEASPHDRIWGIGLGERDPRARDPARWLGLNLLGGDVLTDRVRPAIAALRGAPPSP